MRIDRAGWISLSLAFFLSLAGCVHLNRPNVEIAKFYKKNMLAVSDSALLDGRIVSSEENSIIYDQRASQSAKIFKIRFSSKIEAMKHLMSRRVAISALFRDLIEPYYGLVQKKKCVDLAQFNTDLVEVKPDERYFSVQFPVDRYLNPFDCENENPQMHVRYIFLSCENRFDVYEVRLYQPISMPFRNVMPFRCE